MPAKMRDDSRRRQQMLSMSARWRAPRRGLLVQGASGVPELSRQTHVRRGREPGGPRLARCPHSAVRADSPVPVAFPPRVRWEAAGTSATWERRTVRPFPCCPYRHSTFQNHAARMAFSHSSAIRSSPDGTMVSSAGQDSPAGRDPGRTPMRRGEPTTVVTSWVAMTILRIA
jgi:hypothetical protein